MLFDLLDFIISSIRQVPCSFEYLTNEEVFDYGFTIQFVQKILEKYYCCNSSTISVIDGNSNSNIENFHTHLIIRSKDDVKYFHRDSSLNDEEKQLDNNDNGQDKYNNDHIYNLILNYNFNVECEDKNIELSKSLNLVSSIQNYITQNQMI